MKPLSGALLPTTLLVLAAGPALAHPGHGGASLAAGLIHPLTGADHILAMTAVGLLAAWRGGAAAAAWPVAFVSAMLGGYGLGLLFPGGGFAEPGVMASVIVLGALVAASARVPLIAGATLMAAFGVCHGYAHGAEAPAGAGLGFALGFAVATAALHGVGLQLGFAVRRRPDLMRLMGGGVTLAGLALAMVGQ